MSRLSKVCAAVFLLFSLQHGCGAAAQGLAGYTSRVWQVQDGLPEQTVQAFAQTPDGYLWIGTTGGLLRFDGSRFTLFDRQNTPALREQNVFCLFAAKDGTLWIGTEGGGLVRYRSGVFRSYTARDGISNDFVRALLEDTHGNLWIGTDNGLLRMSGDRIERIDGRDGIPALAIHAIYQDRSGGLWVGGSKLIYLQNGVKEYTLPGQGSQNRVKSIVEAADGSVWVGTVSGLNLMRPGEDRFRRVPEINGTVRVLRQTPDNVLWIGTIGQGLFYLRHHQFSRLLTPSLPSNTVLNFFEDSEKNYWIATQAGMLRLTHTPVSIVRLPQATDADFGTIYEDRDGSFWIASAELFRLQKGTVKPWSFPGLNDVHVRNLYRDASGALWIGTDGSGLYRLAGASLLHFTTAQGLSNNFIRAMAQDHDGSMWIATDEGINHLVPEKQGYSIHRYQMHDGLVYFSTRCLLVDHNGDVWVGTDRGLSHLQHGTFMADRVTSMLSQQKIWSIHEDPDGGLWFGTRNSGLYWLRDGVLGHITMQQGLASNAIYQILEDKNAHFWMSGPTGISLLDRHDLEAAARNAAHRVAVTFYSISDMPEVPEIYGGTQSAGCITASGDIWFPSNKGPIHILPRAPASLPVPALHIAEVSADGTPVSLAQKLTLRPGNSRLVIAYTPIRLGPQNSLRFRYKLEGIDQTWTQPSLERVAHYTNLPPGDYRFLVECFDTSRPDQVATASLEIVQEPFFYRTSWFLAICIAALALIIYAIHKFRVKQMRMRLEAVLEERSRLAREMHDTVIQGCTSISALLEALAMNQKDEPQRSLVDTACEQVRTTIDEARQAVWNLRQNNGVITDFGEKLETMGRQAAHEFGVPVINRITGRSFSLNQAAAHELLMVAREAIYNALFHARPSNVQVQLSFLRQQLVMRIYDDGCGFDPGTLSRNNENHYGLLGMRERVERLGGKFHLWSAHGQGTRIEVSVPCSNDILERNGIN